MKVWVVWDLDDRIHSVHSTMTGALEEFRSFYGREPWVGLYDHIIDPYFSDYELKG